MEHDIPSSLNRASKWQVTVFRAGKIPDQELGLTDLLIRKQTQDF
jgi:hypothetical protein